MIPVDYKPVGAEVCAEGVRYRVWAPDHESVRVVVGGVGVIARFLDLARDEQGYFEGLDKEGRSGDAYRYCLDDHAYSPDPASRFQPQGVFGPSEVVRPQDFFWKAREWRRPDFRGRVVYELHVGTFTTEGTFKAAIEKLPYIANLGVNTIELMPLADFPGRWNWGYDGVFPFAPARCYGTPDELRALVDAAHELGIAVMLDVVYNHLGPTGNPLPSFTSHYFHPKHKNAWGAGLNFDGPHSDHVRAFFFQNVAAWLDDYRFDGLRLDSIHSIADDSPVHFLQQAAVIAHERHAWMVGEDERNLARVIAAPDSHGFGFDAVWADDFHHGIRVALTRQTESHFGSFTGGAGELADTLAHGWHYRGKHYSHWRRARGTDASACPSECFVWCISNHDQVGNRPRGDRLHMIASPAAYRASSLLLCLGPGTPLLFMGQEWGASTPFYFFSDHPDEVGEKMAQGRIDEFASYGIELDEETKAAMPDPQAKETFLSSKLSWDEQRGANHDALLALYRDALGLRAEQPVFQSPSRDRWKAWPINESVVALRWFDPEGDWLLLVALRPAGKISLERDPGLDVTRGARWRPRLDSNSPVYGGTMETLASHEDDEGFRLTAPGCALFRCV